MNESHNGTKCTKLSCFLEIKFGLFLSHSVFSVVEGLLLLSSSLELETLQLLGVLLDDSQ